MPMYASGYSIHSWGIRQIFKQSRNGSLESNKRVMRYLKRTKYYMLTYKRSDQLEITRYFDSDFAGCLDSLRSTSGYIFILASGVVSWRNSKQTLTTSSTMTTKFVVCYEALNHEIWLGNFVTGLQIVEGIEISLNLYCDNK